MEPRIVPEEDVTPELDAAICDTLNVSFPDNQIVFEQGRQWHGTGPAYSIVIERDGCIAGHIGVADRTIRVGDRRMRVAGIMNVCVRPEYRKQGLSDRMMAVALDEAKRRAFDAGMLFCVPYLEKVYARTGWHTSHEPVARIDEHGNETGLPAENITMVIPIVLEAFPNGPIHLQGNDW